MKDKLLELIERRHPRYAERIDHWNFVEATYEGGRSWFPGNIFRYHKEGEKEFKDRITRAYRFNHTKQVVDMVNKYLFKQPIARTTEDAPDVLKEFWKKATLAGLSIDEFNKRVSSATSQYGRIWVVVDSNASDSLTSQAEAKQSGVRIYAYIVRPQDMLDMSYDDQGELNWVLIREFARDDADPMNSSGNFRNLYRLWSRSGWMLFEEKQVRGKKKVEMVDSGVHGLGRVPVINADHTFTEEPYDAPGLIDDVAYLDRANANYLSNLDAIIQDQTFSQLTIPAANLLPGEDGYDKLVEAGTKRIFTYNGEGGGKPEFIAPDPRQASMILSAIGKIINEIYHSVGLTAERSGDDNGGGIDNASGVAKSYDFERVNSLLAAKAAALELFETRLAELVLAWASVAMPTDKDLLSYPQDFDTRGIYDEFEIAARLNLLGAPDDVRREQMRGLVNKLFPASSQEMATKFDKALADWPPEDLMGLGDGTTGGKSDGSAPVKAAATQKTAKELAA